MTPTEMCTEIEHLALRVDEWRSDSDAAPSELVRVWQAAKQAHADLTLVVKSLEQAALKEMDGDELAVDGKLWKRSRSSKREFTSEQKQALHDTAVGLIARNVGRDLVTGEMDMERARAAVDAIKDLERWHTIDPAKFKQAALKPENIDLGDYSTATWSESLREVPQ